MTLTYLILSHGENEVFALIKFIHEWRGLNGGDMDRIIVLNDTTTEDYSARLRQSKAGKVLEHKLEGDYSAHRNFALEHVKTDYVFALDADERPADELIQNIHKLIDLEPDIVWIPRVNLFEGAMPIHALQYGWTITDGMINWPDPQSRMLRMGRGIKWVGKLHERLKGLQGCKEMPLPHNPKCALIHRKSISTQIAQNENYMKNFTLEENAGLSQ